MLDEAGKIDIDKKEPTGCPVCGGRLVEIRGRYPDDPKRKVCPTCLQEMIDDVIDRVTDIARGFNGR